MNDSDNRTLLIASYCVMSTNMALELIAHPTAPDHDSSILGLVFCLIILAALFSRRPAVLVKAATTLNVLLVLIGGYVVLKYLQLKGPSWVTAPDLLVRFYFSVVVPVFAVRYFVIGARTTRAQGTSN